ncbi:MAG: hypothetical protein ACPGK2_02700 [Candidatus Poseidoniaceae archaeon]
MKSIKLLREQFKIRLIIYQVSKQSFTMPWEVGGEDSDSQEKIPTFWDSVEIKPKDVIMSLVDCPYCSRRLRVPETYSGHLTCPSCSKCFQRQNGSILDENGKQIIAITRHSSTKGFTGVIGYIFTEIILYGIIIMISVIFFIFGL